MRAVLEEGEARLDLEFESRSELAGFVEAWRRTEGFMVRLERRLGQFASFAVALRMERTTLAAGARVVQVFERAGAFDTVFQATDPGELAALVVPPEAGPQPPPGADTAAPAGGGETRGVSPAHELRRLNVSERIRLAPRADRTQRRLLARDASPQVLLALLANPRLEEKEVLAIVQSTAASGGVLQRVAKDPRWSGSYEIRLALVKNPKTPTPLATRFLGTLRKRDLQVLAKSGQVREAIKGAALRLYLKR